MHGDREGLRCSRVTAWTIFYPKRVCETCSRYRLGVILSRAGMRDVLALPLGRYFISSGYVRRSRVTAWAIFYPERVCETCLRYRLGVILSRAGMRDVLALPLGRYFIQSGYARRACVTAWAIFYLERVCETLSRYRLGDFLSRAGMRDVLALPLGRFFIPSGYARRSRVTAWALFYPERVCEMLSRYRLGVILSRAGMRDVQIATSACTAHHSRPKCRGHTGIIPTSELIYPLACEACHPRKHCA